MEAGLDLNKNHISQVEWKRQEEIQMEEIKRIFAEARALITTLYD